MMCGSSTAAAACDSWIEPLPDRLVPRQRRGQHLERDPPVQPLVAGQENHRHTAEPIFFSRRYPAITEPGSKPAGKLPPGREKSLTTSSGARPRYGNGLDRYPEHGSSVSDDNGLAGHQRTFCKAVRHGPGDRAVGGPPGDQAAEIVAGVDHAPLTAGVIPTVDGAVHSGVPLAAR